MAIKRWAQWTERFCPKSTPVSKFTHITYFRNLYTAVSFKLHTSTMKIICTGNATATCWCHCLHLQAIIDYYFYVNNFVTWKLWRCKELQTRSFTKYWVISLTIFEMVQTWNSLGSEGTVIKTEGLHLAIDQSF